MIIENNKTKQNEFNKKLTKNNTTMSGRMLVEYGSDLCSNEHHLIGSSENEA